MNWSLRNENYYYKCLSSEIKDDFFFIESSQGGKINGEPFWAIVEIINKYKDHKIALSINKKDKLNPFILNNLNKITLFKKGSRKYWKYLAISKFIISDATLPPFFIKREQQIYTNTWHGTPLKFMGIDEKKPTNISNIQKNFLISDYIITNNNWNVNIFKESYMIKNHISNKILLYPSLRNNIKYLNTSQSEFTSKKKVLFLYTWNSEQIKKTNKLKNKLLYIDEEISRLDNKEDYDFYYSIHYMINNNKFKRFFRKHINNLTLLTPDKEINTEIYNSDIIITDYSSSIFDSSVLKKKIILDFSEKGKYEKNRGFYKEVMDELNFEKVYFIHDIFKKIKKVNWKCEFETVNEKFSTFDLIPCETSWVDDLVSGKIKQKIKEEKQKNNFLIYPGNLAKNGISSSFFAFVKYLLDEGIDVTIWLPKTYISQNKAFNLFKKYKNYDNLSIIHSNKFYSNSIINKVIYNLNFKNKRYWFFKKKFESLMLKESKKIFGSVYFENVIHFSGYESYIFSVLSEFKNFGNKYVYVHNDMDKEWKFKKNYNYKILRCSYERFDKIIFVSNFLMGNIINKRKNKHLKYKTTYINNLLPEEKLNKNNFKLENLRFFGSKSDQNILLSKINNPKLVKILSIGRVSREKNQIFTLKAFRKYKKNINKDSVLIMVGGYSSKRSKLLNIKMKFIIKYSKYRDDIIYIDFIEDPIYLYKNSDLLLMPSKHEGYPMVTLEAAYHGLRSLTSNLPGLEEQRHLLKINDVSELRIRNFVSRIDANYRIENWFDYDQYEREVIKKIRSIYNINE